jgi:superfamily II RNA helicase
MASRIGKFELVITEILVSNLLKESTPAEVAGLFSCLVYQAKQAPMVTSEENAPPDMEEALPPRLKSVRRRNQYNSSTSCFFFKYLLIGFVQSTLTIVNFCLYVYV